MNQKIKSTIKSLLGVKGGKATPASPITTINKVQSINPNTTRLGAVAYPNLDAFPCSHRCRKF
jgi:hypothetical protein